MQQKCEYCGTFINDTDAVCPNCGATNVNVIRSADGVPKTIEELKAFAAAHNLPLEQMRFFIGVDYREPKAFGIYEENGVFNVYKNKSDGTRVFRYRGSDEAYAVNEIYQKMRAEVLQRKQKNAAQPQPTPAPSTRTKRGKLSYIVILVMMGAILLSGLPRCMTLLTNTSHSDYPKSGYYNYHGNHYYHLGSSWYEYDSANGWMYATPADEMLDNYGDYYDGDSYSSNYGVEDFKSSDYYKEYEENRSNDNDNSDYNNDSDYDNDWDSDSDWDWGGSDWDSGDTDWDSDW